MHDRGSQAQPLSVLTAPVSEGENVRVVLCCRLGVFTFGSSRVRVCLCLHAGMMYA